MSDWQGRGERAQPPGTPGAPHPGRDASPAAPPPAPAGYEQPSSAAGGYTQQYGQPYYGQPQQGQPSYSYQPYGQAGYPYQTRRPTNSMAIAALVLTFFFAPVGLILGIIARRQIRQTGEDGDGMALAAIIVSAIFTTLWVLAIIFIVIAAVSFTTTDVSSLAPVVHVLRVG